MGWLKSRNTESIRLESVDVELPGVKGTWVSDTRQRDAAWEMYVELVTRIAVQPLEASEGLIREALSSLYALFGETRRILKTYGPATSRRLRKDALSFGEIALAVLNLQLRPFLAYWHPRLQTYEATRGEKTAPLAHESAWEHIDEARKALRELQQQLRRYARLLAEACGIDPIHEKPGA